MQEKELGAALQGAVAKAKAPARLAGRWDALDFYCLDPRRAPDAWWRYKLLTYLAEHPEPLSIEHPPSELYVGSVWNIGGEGGPIMMTRSDGLEAIKPPQCSIHNRPEDWDWIWAYMTHVCRFAGLPQFNPTIGGGSEPREWNHEIDGISWDYGMVVNVRAVKTIHSGAWGHRTLWHGQKYGFTSDDVLPCPFCGSRDLVIVPNDGRLYCRWCMAEISALFDAKKLVEAWNKRVEKDDGIGCPFCGSRTAELGVHHENFPIMQCRCGARGPWGWGKGLLSGAYILPTYMWTMRNGIVHVPAAEPPKIKKTEVKTLCPASSDDTQPSLFTMA